MQFSVFELSIFCFSSASERLLEMLGTVVAYVDDVLVSLFGFCFCCCDNISEALATFSLFRLQA